MLARRAGRRLVLLAVPFFVLGVYLLASPPEAAAGSSGAVRAAATIVLVLAGAGAAFGAYLWATGKDRVI